MTASIEPDVSKPAIRGISSMATRALLAELVIAFEQSSGSAVHMESVGGVDAARRVQAGEAFDIIVLASDAIDKLIAAGHIEAASKVDLVRCGVAVAVRAGSAHPDIRTEAALRQTVLEAPSLSYSTGPSGVALAKLFERWGIAQEIEGRIVQAPVGIPVGTLVARGEVALGFQQLSELMALPGIDLLGGLPPEVQIVTTFSAGIAAKKRQVGAVRRLLEFMNAREADAVKRRHGMEPAR
jgi:molybdate transport system substrate-binding protein